MAPEPVVRLQRVVRADAAELISGFLDSREQHHPWSPPFTDAAGFDDWFGRTLTGPHVGLVARDSVSGEVVGLVTLTRIVLTPFARSATLGYTGMVVSAGRGLMTEAVRLATVHAFEELGLDRLEANIGPHNARSIALVKRLGFRLEGFSPRYGRIDGKWHAVERWALVADEGP